MGNSKSRQSSGPLDGLPFKDIFEKELVDLNKMITGIITTDNKFVNSSYDFTNGDRCQDYSMILESKLKSHLKIELKTLKEAIYLVPKKDVVSINDKYMSKDTICKVIAGHYASVLELVTLIKQVYDIEHNGDNSLAGITLRNIRFHKSAFMEINYCDIAQKHTQKAAPAAGIVRTDALDFAELAGLKLFTETLLSRPEKNIMLRNLKNLFERRSIKKLGKLLVCGDELLSAQDYATLFNGHIEPGTKCDPATKKLFDEAVQTQDHDLFIKVVKNNPILHTNLCASKQRMLVPLNGNAKEIAALLKIYEHMKSSYVTNLNAMLKIVQQLVETSDGGKSFSLRHIDFESLSKLKQEAKRLVAIFYLQSILNYKRLFETAKRLPSSTLNWTE